MNKQPYDYILITGASRGIGEAVARYFAIKGYFTILTARTETDLARVKKEILQEGGKADYILSDLSNEESARNLSLKLKKDYPFIKFIVLNAGISTNKDFYNQNEENFLNELYINYVSPLIFLKNYLPEMVKRKEGKIVTISSIAGTLPFPGNATYAASKAALISISVTMNIELKKHNIYVGSVLPGLTRTEMTKEFDSNLLPFSEPLDIALAVEEAFRTEKAIIIPGLVNNFITSIYKLFPEPLNSVAAILSNFLFPSENKKDAH